MGRLGGQLRIAPSGGIIGWDMGSALVLARALSVPGVAIAELLPAIEAVMVGKLNEQIAENANHDLG